MDTFAFWYSGKEPEKEIKININFWKVRTKKKRNRIKCLLDIGLLLYKISNIEKVFIYLPFKISKSDISDIGEILIKNKILINCIFNENFNFKSGEDEYLLTILNNDNTEFVIMNLDVRRHINLIKLNNGSILEFNISKFRVKEVENLYFRIRINNPNTGMFVHELKPSNLYFQSAFTNTEIIDFRINEKRLLSRVLGDKIEKDHLFKIKKSHFLVLREITEDVISENQNSSTRLLEDNYWDSYLENKYITKNMIAYHIKDINEKSANFLMRIKYYKTNKKILITYIISIGIFALLINLLTSPIERGLKQIFTKLSCNDHVIQKEEIIDNPKQP